jgi:hypothetical protein
LLAVRCYVSIALDCCFVEQSSSRAVIKFSSKK